MSIEASYETLMKQAGDAADYYAERAVQTLDAHCGPGSAAINPAAIGLLAIAMAHDFHATLLGKSIGELTNKMDQLRQ